MTTFRVLHVIQSFHPKSGGPPEGVRQLIDYFHSQQHPSVVIDVASLDHPSFIDCELVEGRVFPQKKYMFDNLFPFSLFIWLCRYSRNYDRIIVDAVWDWHLLVVFLSFLFTRIPYAVFTHGHLDPWFNKRYKLKFFKKLLFWPWAILPPLFFANKVVFTCDQERLLARKSFPFYSASEFVVSYGTSGLPSSIDASLIHFLNRFPELSGYEIMLFFGRIHPKKGIDILFRSISLLKSNKKWDAKLHKLVIVGPSDKSYFVFLRNLVEDLNIEDSVFWVGPLYGDMKWSAYNASSVFVLSSHQENFGIAIAESLSCSVPVITTDSVNIHHLISDSGAGFVASADVDEFSFALGKWLSLSSDQKKQMSFNARECFERSLSINSFAASYVDLLVAMEAG